tara:strand:- start:1418 stop:3316 length:1899 start_codon:yes stop_codon:yes gene_type:complete
MANKVIKKNEVFLNGKYYPISEPVRQVLASIYPAKVTIGDTTRDSQARASVISWSDFRGGIGVENMEGSKDIDRAWFSTCSLRYKKHLVLAGKPSDAVSNSASGSSTLDLIQEFAGDLYCIFSDQKIYKFTSGNDGFGSALDTLPDVATDALQVRMGGTLYLVIAHTGGYTYTSNASSFTDDTKDAQYLAFWNDKLWGIDNTGQLWHAATLGSETNDAKLPLPSDQVTDLFVARNASGNPILYAMTKQGLYAHDATNSLWVETQLALPFHKENGKGSTRWRDSVYIPAGLGIYKYINGSNSAVVTIVGPDRDDGLPSDYRGTIKGLLGTHNDLLALVDGTLAPDTRDLYASGEENVIPDSTGYSTILGYNETGWEVKWAAPAAGKKITAGYVTDVGSALATTEGYRIYWGYDTDLYWMQLHSDVTNPNQIVNYRYASSGVLETPWYNADQSEVDKLALKLKVETEDCSTGATGENQNIKVEYAIDGKEKNNDGTTAYTTMGTITSDGTTPYTFGSGVGTTFRSIKFKITLTSDGDTKSPDLLSLTLEWRKKLETKFGWSVNLDLSKGYKGNSPKAMRSNILTAIQTNTLLEFTYKDDSTTDRNYYVDIIQAQGLDHTAYDERGNTTLVLAEP